MTLGDWCKHSVVRYYDIHWFDALNSESFQGKKGCLWEKSIEMTHYWWKSEMLRLWQRLLMHRNAKASSYQWIKCSSVFIPYCKIWRLIDVTDRQVKKSKTCTAIVLLEWDTSRD